MKTLFFLLKHKLISLISALLIAPFLVISQPTEEQILASIDLGTIWMVDQQNTDGSWGSWSGEPFESKRVAYTGFALTKLCDRAYEHFYDSPFDPEYEYQQDVIDGFDFLLSQAKTHGPGTGIYLLEGTNAHHETYSASIGLMAVASTFKETKVISSTNPLVNGLTYGQLVDKMVVYFEWGQNDAGNELGGWGYQPNYIGWSDNSHTGYVVLGLRYAEAFGSTVPEFATIRTKLNAWIDLIQNDVNGDSDDGGSEYANNYFRPWTNQLKTGNLLFEMSFYGDALANTRVQDAMDYIIRHWDDLNPDPGWKYSNQAMFCLMKGFDSFSIETVLVSGVDRNWFDEFSTYLVGAQVLPNGYWPSGNWGDEFLNTCWALYVLEKVAPNAPPVAICKDISVFADENCDGWAVAIDFDNGSYDPEGEPLIYSVSPVAPYPLGVTVVTLTVTDVKGAHDDCAATITVLDNTLPAITTIGAPLTMWPPNHKYETFDVYDFVTAVSDNCDYLLEIGDVYFKSISSDEVEDANGGGDGKTFDDMLIADDCMSIQLRKERMGGDNGRFYTVYLGLEDASGNVTEAIVHVTVRHNPGNPAINDDAIYWAIGSCNNGKSTPFTMSNSIESGLYLTNYPNPFNGATTIAFTLNESSNVTLKVYNTLGAEVATLYTGFAEAEQKYTTDFNGDQLSEGIYLYVLQSKGNILGMNKMLLIK